MKLIVFSYNPKYELLNFLKVNKLPYVVLDADKVLNDPSVSLKKLCLDLDVPFDFFLGCTPEWS